MFDIKRIRERAADWLGDVGERALRAVEDCVRPTRSPDEVREAWQGWARSVGAVLDGEEGAVVARSDAPCGGPECAAVLLVGQGRARDNGVWCTVHGGRFTAEPAGTSQPAGQDPAPHPPGGGQGVDEACATCGGSGEVSAEDYTGNMQACDACDGPAVKPPHNAEPGALAGAVRMHNLLASDPAAVAHLDGAPESGLDAMIGYRIVSVRPFADANLCAIAAEATRAASLVAAGWEEVSSATGPALASAIEEQRISHGGCTRLPPEMLAALGVKDGDLVWFLRSTPGGRWEAWTAPELDAQFCIGQDIGPEHVEARKAAVDAMPHHVASRLTAGEARRLEARGFVASVAWHDETSENMYGPWHERDADDLAHVRQKAADRATPPVASAAERGPESQSGGAGTSQRFTVAATVPGPSGEPWTDVATFEGPEAETMARALADSLPLVVNAVVSTSGGAGALVHVYVCRREDCDRKDTPVYHADVPERGDAWCDCCSMKLERAGTARVVSDGAALMSEPAAPVAWSKAQIGPHQIPGVPCDACGKNTSTGRCFVCTVAKREPRSAPPAPPKPDAVRVGQVWQSEAFDSPAEVTDVYDGIANVTIGDRYDDTVPESTMLNGFAWIYLGMVKPSRVEVGQRWRCVGVDGELEVTDADDDDADPPRDVILIQPNGSTMWANAGAMLGLREWSYVGGAR